MKTFYHETQITLLPTRSYKHFRKFQETTITFKNTPQATKILYNITS